MLKHLRYSLAHGPFFAASVIVGSGQVVAQEKSEVRRTSESIELELNKVEDISGACRAYFIVRNRSSVPIEDLKLDTFLFDKAGVILKRVGLGFSEIASSRSKIASFDIPETRCSELAQFVVNEVMSCTTRAGTVLPECADKLSTVSRAEAKLTQ